jgi:hypothetical protein
MGSFPPLQIRDEHERVGRQRQCEDAARQRHHTQDDIRQCQPDLRCGFHQLLCQRGNNLFCDDLLAGERQVLFGVGFNEVNRVVV